MVLATPGCTAYPQSASPCHVVAGHFDWAPRPDEEVFAETPVPAAAAAATAEESDEEDDGVPGEADDIPTPLRGADPENTEVLVRSALSVGSVGQPPQPTINLQQHGSLAYTTHQWVAYSFLQRGEERRTALQPLMSYRRAGKLAYSETASISAPNAFACCYCVADVLHRRHPL